MDQAGSDPLSYLINFGAVGAFLVLWLTGVIVSRRELDRERQRADEWKAQYDAEVTAHGRTLQALELERSRGDAGTEASRTAVAVLSYLGHRPVSAGGDGP
jgi:hypothetical protein